MLRLQGIKILEKAADPSQVKCALSYSITLKHAILLRSKKESLFIVATQYS